MAECNHRKEQLLFALEKGLDMLIAIHSARYRRERLESAQSMHDGHISQLHRDLPNHLINTSCIVSLNT